MDAVVCKKEVLWPMVPAGRALSEFMVHPHIDERNKKQ
jgi:acetolactate synthase-1/2/3 large subunit